MTTYQVSIELDATACILTAVAVLRLPSRPPLVQKSTAGALAAAVKESCRSKCTCKGT